MNITSPLSTTIFTHGSLQTAIILMALLISSLAQAATINVDDNAR